MPRMSLNRRLQSPPPTSSHNSRGTVRHPSGTFATTGYASMDIFRFRDHLTRDYAEYVRSFIRIGTPNVRTVVERAIDDQLRWPDTLVQLNPSYRPGACARDLVADGSLHETTGLVFHRGKEDAPTGLGSDDLPPGQHGLTPLAGQELTPLSSPCRLP